MGSLVLLVFDQLGPGPAAIARKGALDFLSRPFPPNTWFAAFKVGQGLKVVRDFTADRAALRPAIETATLGGGRGTEAALGRTADSLTDEAFQTGLAVARSRTGSGAGGPSAGSASSSSAVDVDAMFREAEARMLRMADLAERERRGWSSLDPLLAIAEGLATVPGRKTVLYFSEGLNVPPAVEDRFRLAIGQANRSNLTFYSLDARGLGAHFEPSVGAITDAPLTQAREAMELAGALAGSPGSDEIAEDALRLNLQGNLRELAEATGGFLVANTNDLAPGLERVGRDLRSYYEIAYVPPRPANDGTYRTIEVRVSRPDVTVRTRRGYYALPPGAPVVQPYELPLVAAFGAKEPPRDFEYRTSTLVFGSKGKEREAVVLVEVPLGTLQVTRDEAAQRYRLRLSTLVHVKDAEGRIVARLSEDWPAEGPLDQSAGLRAGQATFKRDVSLAPGHYTVETAVQDRSSGRASVVRGSFEVPPVGAGPALSLLVVRRTEPAGEGATDTDPLRLGATTIVPDVAPTLRRATRPELPVFLSVYPASGAGPVSVDLELRSDDTVLARSTPELPPPDANGRAASLARFATTTLAPGHYEVRAVAHQGQATTEARALFQVLPDLEPTAARAAPAPSAVLLRSKADKPDAATSALLEKAGRYVLRYGETFRNLVAVETYTQWAGQQGDRLRRQVLRSDIVFVSLPTDIPWAVFRDVFEVNGKPVRDRQARLVQVFRDNPGTAVERANGILRESARYNLAPARRTVNLPTLALLFLHPASQDRFAFRRGKKGRVRGHDVTIVEFEEVSRPTFVRREANRDLPAKGRFWIEPDRGLVARSEVEYRFEPGRALAVVSTDYRPEPGLDIWVPAEMRERYEDLPEAGPHTRVFGEPVEGTARYAHYQRFSVTVIEEKARLPEDAPVPPR
jgi:VWFA-related protein